MERANTMLGYARAGVAASAFVKEQFRASSRVKEALGDKSAVEAGIELKMPTVSLKTARVVALALAVLFVFIAVRQSVRHHEADLASEHYDTEIIEMNTLCNEKADEYAQATTSKRICEQAAQTLGMQRAADGTQIHISAPDTRPQYTSVRYIASNK